MLTLDDEDYELLGYGSERADDQQSASVLERRLRMRVYWNTYAKSAKGREAKARYAKTLKRKLGKRGYSLAYYRRNPEKERARVKRYQQRMKDDPEYKRKAAARALAYYHRNKKLKAKR